MSEISDGEVLYRYASPAAFPEDQQDVPVSIFTDLEMSCDWENIQNKPEESPHISHGRNVIVSIKICDAIRNPTNPNREGSLVPDWKQEIVHDPLEKVDGNVFTPNPSHSLIKGRKKAGVTSAIRANASFRLVLVVQA